MNSLWQRCAPILRKVFCFIPSLSSERRAYLWIILGPVLACIFFIVNIGDDARIAKAAFATFWIAFYWMTEAIPIAATAMMPVVLFPLLSVASAHILSSAYFNDTIFLMIGSFIFAGAMETWGLHRKMALRFLLIFGERPKLLLLGFMLVTAFISCWISNTAVCSMMTPLALAVLMQLQNDAAEQLAAPQSDVHDAEDTPVSLDPIDSDRLISNHESQSKADSAQTLDPVTQAAIRSYSCAVLLGIAYASTVGGTATLIGTGVNIIFSRQYSVFFPQAPPVNFGTWMLFAGTLALIMILLAWGVLVFLYVRGVEIKVNRASLVKQYEELGPFTFPQILLAIVLVVMVVLWFVRPFLDESGIFEKGFVTDGTVSMLMGISLFFIPHLQSKESCDSKDQSDRIADTNTIRKLPWDIVLLMGGGMSLADAFKESGLSLLMTSKLQLLAGLPPFLLVLVICLVVLFVTELTSNVATITLTLPILASMALSVGQHPLLFMIPATICSSYAFMLPVATPPNAIVFSSKHIRIVDMAKAGAALNVVAVLLVPAMTFLLGYPLFDIEINKLPQWVNATATTM